jgi:hypothetical protein
MIIDDSRKGNKIEITSRREIVLKRSSDGQEKIKITTKSSGLGGQAKAPIKKQEGDVTTAVQDKKQ